MGNDGIMLESRPVGRDDRLVFISPANAARARTRSFSIAPRYRMPLVLMLIVFDLAIVAVSLLAVSPHADTLGWAVTIAAMLVLTAHCCGLHVADTSADIERSARGAAALGALMLPIIVAAAWAIGSRAALSHVAVASVIAAAAAVLGRVGCHLAIARLSQRLIERVLIVGGGETGMSPGWSGRAFDRRVDIVGRVVLGAGRGRAASAESAAAALEADMTAALDTSRRGVDRVIILKANLADAQLAMILRCVEAVSFPVHVLTDLQGASPTSGLAAGWVLRDAPIKPGALLTKRCLDVIASASALLLLAPLLLLVAAMVRLETPGPALFRQVRLGRHNRPFTVFKFRTMRADAAAADGSVQAIRGDARVTRIGAVLRRTSLDELPQLLNVLGGSMSLVGPRPHPTELNRRFVPLIESYSARHRMTPGITGWAQVNGLRGETRTIEQMQRRVDFDLEYIRDHSIAFDLWILLRTVISVIASRHAY